MAELDITLTHTPAKALIVLPYRDPDETRPMVRTWIVGFDEEIPADPERFMVDLLHRDHLDEDPAVTMDRGEFEDWITIGEAVVMLLKG